MVHVVEDRRGGVATIATDDGSTLRRVDVRVKCGTRE